ncbi:hypothetical protein FRC02_000405 [Tulasnella sp. 418]|nr:hypothetical protein FRC02_000405 [Tulasnella sp. 418]
MYTESPTQRQAVFRIHTASPLNRDDDTPFWRAYMSEAGKYDKELIDGWSRTFDNFLVFSGLFTSVNTAFIIETYKRLEPDPLGDTANMMRLFLKHRNDDHQFSDEELVLSATSPRKSDIQINRIFFASLWCGLLAALTAVQGKQWLSRYQNHGAPSLPDSVRACNRQRKLDGFERWRFWLLANFLMLILQLSLVLFVCGVMAFLWNVNIDVGGAVMVFTLIGSLVYVVPLVIAILHSYSPYQTHLSHYLRKPVLAFLAFLSIAVNYLLPNVIQPAISWFQRTLQHKTAFRCTPRMFLNLFWPHIILRRITRASKRTIAAKNMSEMQEHVTEMTRADCLGWLFEQAYQTEVVLCTLSGVPSLPPNHLLPAFQKRPGLLSRLAALYTSRVEHRVGKQRTIVNPEETIITGIALFHVLKAHLLPGSVRVDLSISTHRIRIRSLHDSVSRNDHPRDHHYSRPVKDDINPVLGIVICCIEMLLPDSTGADAIAFWECFDFISKSFNSPFTIFIPAPDTPSSTLTDLTVTIFPSGLLLDAVITCAIRHIIKPTWGRKWYEEYKIDKVLSCLREILKRPHPDEPSEETISHIAIVVASIQLARRPNTHQIPLVPEIRLEDILEAWYVVDKRATVFKNIVLAFALAGNVDAHDEDTKDIYLVLLRFLDVYLLKDMEVSGIKTKQWEKWWPDAMNLYPGVLSFLPQIQPDKVPLSDILRMFSRLLPDDWQYNYITEALSSKHTEEIFPQLHILAPSFQTLFHDRPGYGTNVIELIVRSFKSKPGRIAQPDPEAQDAVVELLGWIVAYPGAKEDLPWHIEQYPDYRLIPPFLVSLMEKKKRLEEVVHHVTYSHMPQDSDAMVGRHAARHLLALASLDSETSGRNANLVKLDSLLLIMKNWRLMYHWSEDGKAEVQTKGQLKGPGLSTLVASSFRLFLRSDRDIQQQVREHHVGDTALKGMMRMWLDIPTSRDSDELAFLHSEDTIEALVTYLENHPLLEELSSSKLNIIDTTLDYLNEMQRVTQSDDLRSRVTKMIETLDRVRQPWARMLPGSKDSDEDRSNVGGSGSTPKPELQGGGEMV